VQKGGIIKFTAKKALITGDNSGIGLANSPTFDCGGRGDGMLPETSVNEG
jgi:hypothetical protein